jgi:hypothetical protein
MRTCTLCLMLSLTVVVAPAPLSGRSGLGTTGLLYPNPR